MKLQRYDLIGQNEREIGEYERGNYVLYTDHIEAVSQARADALRWVLEQIQPFPNRFGEWPTVAAEIREKGVNEYVYNIRAIIEKELSK